MEKARLNFIKFENNDVIVTSGLIIGDIYTSYSDLSKWGFTMSTDIGPYMENVSQTGGMKYFNGGRVDFSDSSQQNYQDGQYYQINANYRTPNDPNYNLLVIGVQTTTTPYGTKVSSLGDVLRWLAVNGIKGV